ncbi:MAG: hypothetical protein B6I20_06710 [Bacteroidetes bacterium 4572_117]|nr:MAG: hypothetical protein B6I20_06710 [Bacteroidetes bacterium 4572_117]
MPNKYMKYIFELIFFVSVWHVSAHSQEINYRIDKITVEDGLSNNTVRSITQDKQGFIWFGTESGLNRYDGSKFKIYYNNPNDETSLSTNMIKNIFKDREGNLWIVTSIGGLNKLELEYDKITKYEYPYNVIDSLNLNIYKKAAVVDNDNLLWFSYENNGLYSVDLTTSKLNEYKHQKSDNSSISNNNVRSLFIDSEGIMWAGTNDGILNKFDKKTNTFKHFKIQELSTPQPSSSVIWEIFEDHLGILWIAVDDALYTFDKKTKTTELQIKSKNKNKYYFSYGFVRSIAEDKSDNIWIGTNNGLYRYDRHTRKFINLHEKQNFKSILTDKTILSLYLDKTGVMWVGTLGDGVYKIHPVLEAFKSISHNSSEQNSISASIVRSIYYDNKGYLWVGTIDDGINLVKNGKKIASFNHNLNNPYSLSNNAITGIFQDSRNNYWISTGGNGICVLRNFNHSNTKSARFISYRNNPDNPNSLNSNNATVVFEDSKNNIWVGTNTGLNLFNPVNNQFIQPKLKLKYSNQPSAIQSNCIFEDKTGNLWVGTWYGLYKFNYSVSSGQITIGNAVHFSNIKNDKNSLSDNRITAIFEDQHKNIWIGTYGGGLNRLNSKYDEKTKQYSYEFKNFTITQGLPSNEIYGIQADNKNNLWISTNNGISKFNIENQQVKNYSTQDGLLSNIFFWGASHKSFKGEIFFGNVNGINHFYPDSIKKEYVPTNIVFTDFKVKNKKINPGKNSPIKKQINFAKEITLDHSFETFTIEFALLNSTSARYNKCEFKLEGYNAEWIEINPNNKTATYTNLNPGTYTFKVVQTNLNNPENKSVSEITIKVLGPFWKTWWFYGLEILFLVLIIYAFIKLREKKLKRDNYKLEQTVEKNTLKVKQQHKEILEQNEEIKLHNEKISKHNEVLNQYKSHLENLVEERTKKLEEALSKATEGERLKTAFLENLSHEIRTPLNAIVGFSQLLGNPDIEPEDMENYISKIHYGSDSLLKILDSIMFVSKIQIGEYKPYISEFLLNDLLLEHFNNAKNAIAAKKNKDIKINLNTNLNSLIVRSDKSCISLVLSNMVDNALKFTEKGSIEIKVSKKTDNLLHFMVEDTGIGIKKEDIDYVFDKFRKGEKRKSKLYGGLGVGLATSKSVIDILGGEIGVDSEENKGSAFYFTIPI